MKNFKLIKAQLFEAIFFALVALGSATMSVYILYNKEVFGDAYWMILIAMLVLYILSTFVTVLYFRRLRDSVYYMIVSLPVNCAESAIKMKEYQNSVLIEDRFNAWAFNYQKDKIAKLEKIPFYFVYNRRKELLYSYPIPFHKTKRRRMEEK